MLTKGASVVTIIALLLLVGSPAQVGQSPKQALSPQLYNSLKIDSDKLDLVISQHMKMMNKLEEFAPIISRNSEHLRAMDQRIDSLQDRFEKHEIGGASAPTSIAVLQAQLNAVIEGQKQDRAVASWILTGVGGLILGLLGWVAKSLISKGLPPEWAVTQSDRVAARLDEHNKKQEEYRDNVLTGLHEVKSAAMEAYKESNNINKKLVSIGVQILDKELIGQERQHEKAGTSETDPATSAGTKLSSSATDQTA